MIVDFVNMIGPVAFGVRAEKQVGDISRDKSIDVGVSPIISNELVLTLIKWR